MKKIVFTLVTLCFMAISATVAAQDEKIKEKEKQRIEIERKIKEIDEKKQSQEIIIRKKGDKDAKITVEINGDNVTINGKPLSEFNDENLTVNKRKMTIAGNNMAMGFENMSKGFENMAKGFDLKHVEYLNKFKNFNGYSIAGDGDGKPYAFLGVTTGVMEDDANNKKVLGALITNINDESAADKAGLKEGDLITRINDKKVDGPDMLSAVVRSFKPKEEVTVYYKRDGKENSAKTVLGERKDSNSLSFSFSGPDELARAYTLPKIPKMPNLKYTKPGIEMWNNNGNNNLEFLGDMFPRQQKLGLKIQDTEEGNGVKILDVDKDSPAEKAGLKKDDVVTEVGSKKVNNTDEARELLHENQDKSSYSIKAKRNGTEMNFDIKIPKKLKTANL